MTETLVSSSGNLGHVEEFITRFLKQAGSIYPAKDPDEAAALINGLIQSRGRGESCCSEELQFQFNGSLVDISSKIKPSIDYKVFEKDPRKIMGMVDVGITKAECGIAETGSIVDVSYSDGYRLLSSLTRVHIALLERSRIFGKLSMLSPMMKELLYPGKGPRLPSITFIGGPSRTSDIELKSVLGVHGPHEVHVVLV
jgi:L-lactate utilization protein LutC